MSSPAIAITLQFSIRGMTCSAGCRQIVGDPEVITSATLHRKCESTGDFRMGDDSLAIQALRWNTPPVMPDALIGATSRNSVSSSFSPGEL
jgi:hypothetical protein